MTARVFPLVLVLAAATVAAQSTVSTETAVIHGPYPNGQSSELGSQIDALLAQPAVSRAHWGIAVTELDGTPIYGHDEGKIFRPASNNKLFTTAAAMELLKPETTVDTKAWFTLQPSDNGEVKGNVVLSGAGDANFSDTEFPYRNPAQRKAAAEAAGQPLVAPDPLRYFDELAQKIAAKGVKRVDGNIIGDDTAWTWEPYPESWGLDDLTWGYGAPVSALTAEDNELEIHVAAGAKAGDPATFTLKPDLGYYKEEFSVKTVEKGASNAYDVARDPGSHTLRIYGTIAVGGEDTSHLAINDPAEFSALALQRALEAHGVTVAGKAVALHQRLVDASSFYRASHEPITEWMQQLPVNERTFASSVSHTSPTVADDVVYTLKVSQNLHAEMFLRRLGAMYGTPSSNGDHSTAAQGVRVVRQFLVNAGVDGDDFVLFDGSGLSDHDLVAPRAFAQLLTYAQKRPWFQQWFAGLPVGGEDGTLRSRFAKAPLKDHVFAKTGTLGESRALSGYLDCASGKRVIFSIMVDDHAPGGPDGVTMDKIVAAIAAAE